MISGLEYFGDTLSNVGLPKTWLECDSNCVNRIKTKYVIRELNRIKKTQLSLIKLEKIESNQIDQIEKQFSGIQAETADSMELRMPMMLI